MQNRYALSAMEKMLLALFGVLFALGIWQAWLAQRAEHAEEHAERERLLESGGI